MKLYKYLLAVLIVCLPVIGSETFAATNNSNQPGDSVSPMTHLSFKTAPAQWLGLDEGKIDVKVGESRSEKEKRLEAERQAALANQREEVKRAVMARAGDRERVGLGVDEAIALTQKYANQYSVDMKTMTAIIGCESGYNQFAKNRSSTASGYGQFLASTWKSAMRAMGRDVNTSPFDAEANIEATAFVLQQQGTRPWAASRSCWSRY